MQDNEPVLNVNSQTQMMIIRTDADCCLWVVFEQLT